MSGPVAPVTVVQALLLRTALPDLPLDEGASFLARVASRGDKGAASLVIAGQLVPAKVPEEVVAGQTLRLTVAGVTPERITLRLEPAPQQAPAPSPVASPLAPPPPVPLRVSVDDRGGRRGAPGPAGEASVALTVQTPALGTLRLLVVTAPTAVSATIQVPPEALEAAQARAERLRADLAAQTGRAAAVRVVPGAVDVRA